MFGFDKKAKPKEVVIRVLLQSKDRNPGLPNDTGWEKFNSLHWG